MSDAMDQQTDFRSHRIEGIARAAVEAGKEGWFSTDLISHIEGNLWSGGCIGGVALPEDFAHVVSLYPWEKYRIGENTHRVEITMLDSGDQGMEQVDEIAESVVAYAEEGKTLVHCQAGLNRSGLICARALMLMGRTAEEAIALLREKRCSVVLCNESFERWLLDHDSEGTITNPRRGPGPRTGQGLR